MTTIFDFIDTVPTWSFVVGALLLAFLIVLAVEVWAEARERRRPRYIRRR